MRSWGGARSGAAGIGNREDPQMAPSSSPVRHGLVVALHPIHIPAAFNYLTARSFLTASLCRNVPTGPYARCYLYVCSAVPPSAKL